MLKKHIKEYLDWKASYTSKASKTYALHLYRFDNYMNKELKNITLSDMVNYQLYLKNKYSIANVAYAITIIKNFFLFYKKQGVDCLDPSFIRRPKFVAHSHYSATTEEYNKMLSVLNNNDFWELEKKVIISLLYDTGVRISELKDLNISDVNSNESFIITKKGYSKRWIFWSDKTHKLLKEYLHIRVQLNQSSPLFISSQNQSSRISTRTLERWVADIKNRAKIDNKITPHSFRHCKAHRILKNPNGTVKDVQIILGHNENNPASAFSYLRINNREAKERAKLFL